MKILARAHDVCKADSNTLAKSVKEAGYDGVQLVLYKGIEGCNGAWAGTMDEKYIKDIAASFKNEGLEVAMLGAYFNPVHSNKELVEKCINRFKNHLSFAHLFDCNYVGSETGSYNDDQWTYNPLNRTEEAFLENKRIWSDILAHAKSVGANVALEGAYGHCMHNPQALHRLYNEINNGNLFITLDVFNYLHPGDFSKEFQHSLVDDSLALFGDNIKIYHLKDFIFDAENNKLKQVGLGEGLMDLDYIVSKALAHTPNAVLVFEGCPKDKIESSIKHIKSILNK